MSLALPPPPPPPVLAVPFSIPSLLNWPLPPPPFPPIPIALDGFTASTTGALKAGDLIKFANHSKVYMVQSDIDSNSSGELTVLISPNLVAALADNEAVTVNKPSFTVYLENNEIMYSTDASGLYTISFDVREVIS